MTTKHESGSHAIWHGDALAVLKNHVADASIDLVIADCPYGIGKAYGDFNDRWPCDDAYQAWAESWLAECIRVLHPSGSMYVMAGTQATPGIDLWLRSRMHVLGRIVWAYDSSGVQAKRHYGSMYEPVLFAVKDARNYTFNANDILVDAPTGSRRKLMDYRRKVPRPYASKKVPGNVWHMPRVRYRMAEYEDHPTQKPEALIERMVLASSNAGDTVLDPFAGSFATGAVARRLGRASISIERHAPYVDIGLRRVLGMERHPDDGKIISKPRKSSKSSKS